MFQVLFHPRSHSYPLFIFSYFYTLSHLSPAALTVPALPAGAAALEHGVRVWAGKAHSTVWIE